MLIQVDVELTDVTLCDCVARQQLRFMLIYKLFNYNRSYI